MNDRKHFHDVSILITDNLTLVYLAVQPIDVIHHQVVSIMPVEIKGHKFSPYSYNTRRRFAIATCRGCDITLSYVMILHIAS
jgi:hypothetical protein